MYSLQKNIYMPREQPFSKSIPQNLHLNNFLNMFSFKSKVQSVIKLQLNFDEII